MVDVSIPAGISAFAGVAVPGARHGRKDGAAGVTIVEVTGLTIASVAARRGQAAETSAKIQALFGFELPAALKRASSGDVSAVWSAPDQWLVQFATGGRARVAELAEALRGLASVTDQTDSRAVLEVSGPRVREMLAKGVMVDLHPSVFQPGDTAVTLVAHIGAQITMLGAAPSYQLMIPRSFCLSFWDWLIESAEEYGVMIGGR